MRAKTINEIYSDEDFEKGDNLEGVVFGITLNFKGDFRRKKLLIKKLVRAKYQITDPTIKALLDEVIDALD